MDSDNADRRLPGWEYGNLFYQGNLTDPRWRRYGHPDEVLAGDLDAASASETLHRSEQIWEAFNAKIAELGESGWEAIAASPDSWFFKRPIPASSDVTPR